ncbi:MAG: rhomboid family intramembrane serine protease [Verrucomicrobia bacterium]|nr:rhomboid family intramembrane serine protease [Verrucomicrobiota bacterium]
MSDQPLPPLLPAEATFAIEYDEFAGRSFAASARGRGTLVIQGAGPSATYTFTGPTAPSLSLGGELAFAFDAGKVKNVAVEGTRIEFFGTLRSGVAPGQQFAFHCATPADAAAVARLFPATQDADFVADHGFAERLARLPAASSPWTSVTGLLIVANVLVFAAMGLAGAGWINVADMAPYARYGANYAPLTTDGQWWRLVASMFLHYGVIHLGLNMWALFQTGQLLERLLGRPLYLLVYFGSGLTGSLTTLVWHGTRGAWSAGASGAVFGVFGALVGYMLHEKHALPKSVWQPLLSSVTTAIGYNLVFGVIAPGIDNDLETRRRLLVSRLGLGTAAVAVALVIGVAAAPRFDYHFADELDWDTAFRSANNRDNDLLATLDSTLQGHRPGQPSPDLARLLRDDILPFNEAWTKSLADLSLEPGRRTARRRDLVLAGLRLRLDAYRHLLAAVERSDPEAVRDFKVEMRASLETLAKAQDLR